MSFNRLKYDSCSYKSALSQSIGHLDHIFDSARFEHEDKCYQEKGMVAGPSASHIKGNMVDLESDLIGITRPSTLCDNFKHTIPTGDVIYPKEYSKFAEVPNIHTELKNIPTCKKM